MYTTNIIRLINNCVDFHDNNMYLQFSICIYLTDTCLVKNDLVKYIYTYKVNKGILNLSSMSKAFLYST